MLILQAHVTSDAFAAATADATEVLLQLQPLLLMLSLSHCCSYCSSVWDAVSLMLLAVVAVVATAPVVADDVVADDVVAAAARYAMTGCFCNYSMVGALEQ